MSVVKRAAVILLLLIVSGGLLFSVYYFCSHYAPPRSSTVASTSDCPRLGADHTVIIQNEVAAPVTTQAHLCDRLTIVNKDAVNRLMAFGVHDHHQAYDHIEERQLRTGESFSVVLDQAGTYIFHDHLDDGVQGKFIVSK